MTGFDSNIAAKKPARKKHPLRPWNVPQQKKTDKQSKTKKPSPLKSMLQAQQTQSAAPPVEPQSATDATKTSPKPAPAPTTTGAGAYPATPQQEDRASAATPRVRQQVHKIHQALQAMERRFRSNQKELSLVKEEIAEIDDYTAKERQRQHRLKELLNQLEEKKDTQEPMADSGVYQRKIDQVDKEIKDLHLQKQQLTAKLHTLDDGLHAERGRMRQANQQLGELQVGRLDEQDRLHVLQTESVQIEEQNAQLADEVFALSMTIKELQKKNRSLKQQQRYIRQNLEDINRLLRLDTEEPAF